MTAAASENAISTQAADPADVLHALLSDLRHAESFGIGSVDLFAHIEPLERFIEQLTGELR
jgi:hypothetical protein